MDGRRERMLRGSCVWWEFFLAVESSFFKIMVCLFVGAVIRFMTCVTGVITRTEIPERSDRRVMRQLTSPRKSGKRGVWCECVVYKDWSEEVAGFGCRVLSVRPFAPSARLSFPHLLTSLYRTTPHPPPAAQSFSRHTSLRQSLPVRRAAFFPSACFMTLESSYKYEEDGFRLKILS